MFFCLLANYPSLPRSRENIVLNFDFKNEATRANLKANKRPLNGGHFGIRCIVSSLMVLTLGTNLSLTLYGRGRGV